MRDHRSLVSTIRQAFIDRPGLEVSFEEACHHWRANEAQCAAALDELAAERFLVRLDDGSYRQAAISQTNPIPLPDATLKLDTAWRIVSFDLRAASLLRREAAELYGAHISGLLPGSGLGTAADAELKQRGCIRRVVHLSKHSVTLDVVACRSDHAIVVNVKDSSVDALTARVHALATRLELAGAVAGLGFWEWDIQRDRVKWDGTKYRGAPGTVEDGIPIEAFYDMVHSEDRGAVRRAIEDAVQLGTPYRIRFRFVWPGSTVRWAAATGIVERAESGQAVSLVGVSHDITERVLAEEERNTLATSVRRKEEMVAVVSNELRQPLGEIQAALQLLEQRLDTATDERARRTIDEQVRHLSRIVDELHDPTP